MRDFLNTLDRTPSGVKTLLSSIVMLTMVIVLVYILESLTA